jgi:uncharacterized protein YgiM (DUF1202 family)
MFASSQLLVLTLATIFAARDAEAAQCACATDSLHVRNGAGTSHAVIHTMNAGECLPYQGDSASADGYTWYHLTYNGQVFSMCFGHHFVRHDKFILFILYYSP